MNISSSLAYWLLVIIMQFTPADTLNIGDFVLLTNNQYTFEFVVTDIPAEDYWEISFYDRSLENEGLLYRTFGYSNQGQYNIFSIVEFDTYGGENNIFSVNDAGEPFILRDEGNPYSFIKLSPDIEAFLDFTDKSTFQFKGGEDFSYSYKKNLVELEITEKVYSGGSPEFSSVRFNLDGDIFYFWRIYEWEEEEINLQ